MDFPKARMLHESADLLVINKPAGLVCHPSKTGPMSSLVGQVRVHVGATAEVHLINRLDRETSGLVLVAKNREWARYLRRIWEQRQVQKRYYALVHGHPTADAFTVGGPLGKDEESPVAVKDCVRPDGAPSETGFEVRERFWRDGEPYSLILALPRSGRKHQIRIHLAHAGFPIVGDKLYGREPDAYLDMCYGRLSEAQRTRLILDSHALHAFELEFVSVVRSPRLRAEVNPEMLAFCRSAQVQDPEVYRPSEIAPGLDLDVLESMCRDFEPTASAK